MPGIETGSSNQCPVDGAHNRRIFPANGMSARPAIKQRVDTDQWVPAADLRKS
jgi:hypothetical protein